MCENYVDWTKDDFSEYKNTVPTRIEYKGKCLFDEYGRAVSETCDVLGLKSEYDILSVKPGETAKTATSSTQCQLLQWKYVMCLIVGDLLLNEEYRTKIMCNFDDITEEDGIPENRWSHDQQRWACVYGGEPKLYLKLHGSTPDICKRIAKFAEAIDVDLSDLIKVYFGPKTINDASDCEDSECDATQNNVVQTDVANVRVYRINLKPGAKDKNRHAKLSELCLENEKQYLVLGYSGVIKEDKSLRDKDCNCFCEAVKSKWGATDAEYCRMFCGVKAGDLLLTRHQGTGEYWLCRALGEASCRNLFDNWEDLDVGVMLPVKAHVITADLKERYKTIMEYGYHYKTIQEWNGYERDCAQMFNEFEPGTYDFTSDYAQKLKSSRNMILHGAPGTGKTFLAHQIATEIVSNGNKCKYEALSEEEKQQIGFVQFHPSYDYVDFVEGLRPVDEGQVTFKLMPGVFKSFVDDARENKESYDKSNQNPEVLSEELDARSVISSVLSEALENGTEYSTKRSKFCIEEYNDSEIVLSIPDNVVSKSVTLLVDDLTKLLMSGHTFEKAKDVSEEFGRRNGSQADSYYFSLWRVIYNKYKKSREEKSESSKLGSDVTIPLKNYVFIIDEINRGDISKIFGELFFSIDPGYRGQDGEVSTQYANLHKDPNEKFYIPDNVYIIGTMNDIDRSVDSFDFAMRRRFRFVELKAKYTQHMLDDAVVDSVTAKKYMDRLNGAIVGKEVGLNENYQIGAAYFKKLAELGNNYELLWQDYLQPLLHEYVRGMDNEEKIMKRLSDAYFNKETESSEENGAGEDGQQ